MHGFGLNVCGPLGGFDHITPCGLEGVEMTSLEAEGASKVTVESASLLAAEVFTRVFRHGKTA
jgi:lipoate-protein ligase B